MKTVEVKAPPKVPEGKGGEDDQDQLSNHAQLLELTVSHDLCFPQTWMQKADKNRITHQRPNGDPVQLAHAINKQARLEKHGHGRLHTPGRGVRFIRL